MSRKLNAFFGRPNLRATHKNADCVSAARYLILSKLVVSGVYLNIFQSQRSSSDYFIVIVMNICVSFIQSAQRRNVSERASAKPAKQVKNIVTFDLSQLHICQAKMICATRSTQTRHLRT